MTTTHPAPSHESPTLWNRRVRWNRTWTRIAIAAIIIVSVGSYFGLRDLQDLQRNGKDVGSPPAIPPKDVSPTDWQSTYKGVFVDVTSFEKRGELVTLELIFRNTSEERLVCSRASQAKLIDELTGESWRAVHHGGSVGGCGSIGSGESGGAWMKFKIQDPEKRHFSLSIPSLNRTPELVLRYPSGN